MHRSSCNPVPSVAVPNHIGYTNMQSQSHMHARPHMCYAAPTFPQNILLNNQNKDLQLRNGVNLFAAYKTIDFSGVTGTLKVNEHGTRVMQASLRKFVDTSWIEIGRTDGGNTQLPLWSSLSHVKPWGQAEVMQSLSRLFNSIYPMRTLYGTSGNMRF